jgi:hypothetical protein
MESLGSMEIGFSILHGICAVLTIMQLVYIVRGKRFQLYWMVLVLNLLHQISSILALLVAYPSDRNPFWICALEVILSRALLCSIVYLNLAVLEMFSFLFDSLEPWIIRVAKVSTMFIACWLGVLQYLRYLELPEYLSLLIKNALRLSICIVGFVGIVHDNIQYLLILNRVYHVSKAKIDQKTLKCTRQALVPTVITLCATVLMDWYRELTQDCPGNCRIELGI